MTQATQSDVSQHNLVSTQCRPFNLGNKSSQFQNYTSIPPPPWAEITTTIPIQQISSVQTSATSLVALLAAWARWPTPQNCTIPSHQRTPIPSRTSHRGFTPLKSFKQIFSATKSGFMGSEAQNRRETWVLFTGSSMMSAKLPLGQVLSMMGGGRCSILSSRISSRMLLSRRNIITRQAIWWCTLRAICGMR